MKNKKGLTLVEVVVALAVFMIAVVMAYPIITLSGQSNIKTNKKLELQETGVYVAENLRYIALNSSSKTKDEFLSSNKLITSGLCVQGDCSGDEVITGPFNKDSNHQYTKSFNRQTITLTFKDNSNIVNILVTEGDVKYETMEWLRYE